MLPVITETTTMSTPSPRFVDGEAPYIEYVDTNAAPGAELSIWTIAAANLDYFIDIAGAGLAPKTSTAVVVAQSLSKGGNVSVQRWPGDTAPCTRANVAKTIMKNRQVRHGNALAGRRFILDDGIEKRQFTYQGDLHALHALLVGNLKVNVKFTNYNGAWEYITAPSAG